MKTRLGSLGEIVFVLIVVGVEYRRGELNQVLFFVRELTADLVPNALFCFLSTGVFARFG
jgi:hypothetical protein